MASAFSIGRYMPSSGFSHGSRKVLEQLLALVALVPLAVAPVALSFDSAVVTRHLALAFFRRKSQNDSGRRNPAFGASPRFGPKDG